VPIANSYENTTMITCAFCNQEIEIQERVSRNDTCPRCGRDLHCCLQCKFYDSGSYNECREVLAERVLDKEKGNRCEYFVLRGLRGSKSDKKGAAKKALDDLFRKK
jgi:predicted RNA-binding Zn-ribbon protein involved in translation (DUF1610 family)